MPSNSGTPLAFERRHQRQRFERRTQAQIKRKWPATEDDFRFGEEAITFLAASRA
jgi:hypothetical protein